MRTPATAAMSAIGAVTLLASTVSAADLPSEHAASRARWAAAEVDAYEYAYHKYCECHEESPPETVVAVSGAAVVGVHHRHPDSEREVPAREGSLEYYWTVDDLFALVESATARDATVRASYDATLGHPTRVYIDYDPALVGDEVDVRLTRLDVVSR
jgi:hypothetical protein